jgi:signal transduction histidine kinase
MFLFLGVRLPVATAFLLFSFSPARAQNPYPLSDISIIHRLDRDVAVFVDSTNAASIGQILSSRFQDQFHPSGENLTFGYLNSTIWLKVVTTTNIRDAQWYMEIPAPFLEYVDFYQLAADGQWSHVEAGYYRPHNIREHAHTGHVLSLVFNAGMSTVFVKISGSSPKTFPLLVMEKEKFNEKVRHEDLGYGIFFGILIVMFFFNLFIFLTLQHANYLLYICTIVCTFLIFSSASGYAGKFLWPDVPMLNFYAGRMTLGVLTIFLAVFTIRFLEVRTYSTLMYYLLLSLVPLAVIATVLVATGTVSSAGNNLVSVSILLYMTTGIVCRLKGNKTANYFIAAWTIYMAGGLLLTLRNSGVLDFNFWTTHFVEIGAALETIIIAFALGDRYRRYKLEKEQAQAMALQIQQQATEELEVKVKERTEELSLAYAELNQTLETNKLQTQIIEHKNAELDAFFYRISHDLKGPISSLLGLSSLARIDIQDVRAQNYIERQHRQVERLNNIITGLIQLTKLNDSDLLTQKIDFEKMIDDCILSFNGFPNFRNITFRKDIQPVEFFSEWTLLNAIFQNLIENAIKYSRETAPFVSIRVREENGCIAISVEDNGQGIPHEHQPRIFEMFYRASQHAQGTGLGLYILKRSVDRLKGDIEVQSTPGAGTTFLVRLPFVPASWSLS